MTFLNLRSDSSGNADPHRGPPRPSAGLPLSPSDSLGEFILQAVPLTYAYILIGFFASLPIKCLYLEMI